MLRVTPKRMFLLLWFLTSIVYMGASRPAGELEFGDDAWYSSINDAKLEDHLTLSQRISHLSKTSVDSLVQIRLVGFGGGSAHFKTLQHDLQIYLESSVSLERFRLQQVEPVVVGSRSGLSAKEQLQQATVSEHPVFVNQVFDVSFSKKKLAEKLQSALALPEQHPATSDEAVLVNPELVERILLQDYEGQLDQSIIYIMLLDNPPPRSYKYVTPMQNKGQFEIDPIVPCAAQHGIGEGNFAWIDLRAGPVSFGPFQGEGGVNNYSMPRVPLTNDISPNMLAALAADLAAVCRKAVSALFVPPFHHFPVAHMPTVKVNIVVISDRIIGDPAKGEQQWEAWLHVKKQLESFGSANPQQLQQQQPELFASDGQQVKVELVPLHFTECELCASALSHSIRTHSSDLSVQYIDFNAMYEWLEHFENFWGLRTSSVETDKGSERVYVAFVYDLDRTGTLLMDGKRQAMGAGEIVAAVQTGDSSATYGSNPPDFQCDGKGVRFDPRDASRAVLAELLTVIWGVAPTSMAMDAYSSTPRMQYDWAVSRTVFGPFSTASHVSMPLREIASRNRALSELVSHKVELANALNVLVSVNHSLDLVTSESQHLTFLRRWHVFQLKEAKARQAIAVNNHVRAFSIARSMKLELAAVEAIVHSAREYLKIRIHCKDKAEPYYYSDSSRSRLEAVMLICFLFGLAWLLFVQDQGYQTLASLVGIRKKQA